MSQFPVRGVPDGLLIAHVAPPGEAVTAKDSGRPPAAVAPVTVTVAVVPLSDTVGVCGVPGASPAAPTTNLVHFGGVEESWTVIHPHRAPESSLYSGPVGEKFWYAVTVTLDVEQPDPPTNATKSLRGIGACTISLSAQVAVQVTVAAEAGDTGTPGRNTQLRARMRASVPRASDSTGVC